MSTIDLIGDGLTILAGPADPRWSGAPGTIVANAPVTVHVLDAGTASALGLPPDGALLTRPDRHELRRWASFAAAAASPGST